MNQQIYIYMHIYIINTYIHRYMSLSIRAPSLLHIEFDKKLTKKRARGGL